MVKKRDMIFLGTCSKAEDFQSYKEVDGHDAGPVLCRVSYNMGTSNISNVIFFPII